MTASKGSNVADFSRRRRLRQSVRSFLRPQSVGCCRRTDVRRKRRKHRLPDRRKHVFDQMKSWSQQVARLNFKVELFFINETAFALPFSPWVSNLEVLFSVWSNIMSEILNVVNSTLDGVSSFWRFWHFQGERRRPKVASIPISLTFPTSLCLSLSRSLLHTHTHKHTHTLSLFLSLGGPPNVHWLSSVWAGVAFLAGLNHRKGFLPRKRKNHVRV